jgi:hypothetical protein
MVDWELRKTRMVIGDGGVKCHRMGIGDRFCIIRKTLLSVQYIEFAVDDILAIYSCKHASLEHE